MAVGGSKSPGHDLARVFQLYGNPGGRRSRLVVDCHVNLDGGRHSANHGKQKDRRTGEFEHHVSKLDAERTDPVTKKPAGNSSFEL